MTQHWAKKGKKKGIGTLKTVEKDDEDKNNRTVSRDGTNEENYNDLIGWYKGSGAVAFNFMQPLPLSIEKLAPR